MPELPEVEFARRSLTRWLRGHRVVRAESDDTRIFRGADRQKFAKLKGALERIDRRGKYLLLSFERDRGLLAHLGMTGKFVRRPRGHEEPWSRARLVLESGEVIHFRDPRLFGRLEPVAAGAREVRRQPLKSWRTVVCVDSPGWRGLVRAPSLPYAVDREIGPHVARLAGALRRRRGPDP